MLVYHPSFEEEYNLKVFVLIGNAIHNNDIKLAKEKCKKYSYDGNNAYSKKPFEADPGFSSSPFNLEITDGVDSFIQIVYGEEFEIPDMVW